MEQDGTARRIIAAIKAQIHSGAYRPGDRLPSTRAFAAERGASRTTVTAAYNQLDAQGYLIIRQARVPSLPQDWRKRRLRPPSRSLRRATSRHSPADC
ncbi:winged helix-turn-helix domain-containing protein [Mesorhizobium sp. WSM4884]|uniref:winged helix-turn-helix domain-containing protein n=1 Tax=Mesorhizobium sp. WSM4884 TaxID=3038542 RepID=UPI0024175CD7|nr:winged helix-turn-helix domain-containing protein [Mesorhizobium sp. WSM4884]MDG4880307.1 winged helix-turn-helix domain-containing protein [Mesorhizobium sp. WSM4884]